MELNKETTPNKLSTSDWDVIDEADYEKFDNLDAVLDKNILELSDDSDDESFHEEPIPDIDFDLDFTSDHSERELFPHCVYWKQYYPKSHNGYLRIDSSEVSDTDESILSQNKNCPKKKKPRDMLYICTGLFISFIFFCYILGE